MSEFKIVVGNSAHLSSLISLASSVEHLFGPMIGHGFEEVLETNVDRKTVLVAVDLQPSGDLLGGIIFDQRDAPNYHVRWLAVREQNRGVGVGRSLLLSTLQRFSSPANVEVVTFGPDNTKGMPARKLYESCGFRAGKMTERGPEGGSRQLFELKINA